MWWALIIFAVVVLYLLRQVEKRIDAIDQERGLGYSYSFAIDLKGAIYDHPKFLKDSKIKSAIASIPYSKWPDKDKEAYGRFIQKTAINKGWAYITYLTS